MTKRRYELKDINLPASLKDFIQGIGSRWHLSGILYSGEGITHVVHFPGEHFSRIGRTLDLSPEELQLILKQADNPEFPNQERDKPWIRKSQWVLSGMVQQRIWLRDYFICIYCGAKFGETLFTVDHIWPLSYIQDNSPGNLVSACRKCNKDKGEMMPITFCTQRGIVLQDIMDWVKVRNEGGNAVIPAHLLDVDIGATK